MEHRVLGTTGVHVSVLGFGTWQLAGRMGAMDRSDAESLIRGAIDGGLTFIDTAEAYGDSEKIIGKALGEGYREKCFLATKASEDFTAGGIENAVQNSLNALRTDRIDLYQLHRYDPDVPLEESLGVVSRLMKDGSIRFVGVSNFTVEQLEQAETILPIVSNQINYNALNRSAERQMLGYCHKAHISVLAHSSLAKGLLCGKYGPEHTFAPDDERSSFPGYSGDTFAAYLALVEELKEAAAKRGLTVTQAAIAWLLAQEEVTSVLIGPKDLTQLEEAAFVLGAIAPQHRIELRAHMNDILENRGLPPLCPFPSQLV